MGIDSNGNLTAKIASLSTLQTIITRMATVSVSIKTIYITVFGFFISGYWLDGGFVIWQKYLTFFFVMFFFIILDSYYLSVEKKYRFVYEALSEKDVDGVVNFFIWKPYYKNFQLDALKSFSVWGFYISVFAIYVLVVSVAYDMKNSSESGVKDSVFYSKVLKVMESQEKTQKEILSNLTQNSGCRDGEYKIENNISIDNTHHLSTVTPKKTTSKPIVRTCN